MAAGSSIRCAPWLQPRATIATLYLDVVWQSLEFSATSEVPLEVASARSGGVRVTVASHLPLGRRQPVAGRANITREQLMIGLCQAQTVFHVPASSGQACQGVPHATSTVLGVSSRFAHATLLARVANFGLHHSGRRPQVADTAMIRVSVMFWKIGVGRQGVVSGRRQVFVGITPHRSTTRRWCNCRFFTTSR